MKDTDLPVFVMIISVPNSWNLSHNSFVSKWHCTGRRSSELHVPTIVGRDWIKGEDEKRRKHKISTMISQMKSSCKLPLLVLVLIAPHRMVMAARPVNLMLCVNSVMLLPNHYTVPHPHRHHRRLRENDQLIWDLWDGEGKWKVNFWVSYNIIISILIIILC